MTLFCRPHVVTHAIGHAVHDVFRFAHFRALHLPHRHGRAVAVHGRQPVVHGTAGSSVQELEGRLLMSAAHLPAADPVLASAAKPTHASVASVVVSPAAVADPALTDRSFVYRSFAADPLFATGGPGINDISQGELGDCYLLSVLSSVAKTDSALVRHLITENANGTYTVTFAGKATVTVNADLPTLPDGGPAYAQLGTDNSLWVALVEKAYADYVSPKVDSYAMISGGWMGDVFTAIGLKSSSTFATSSPTALAALLQKDLKGGDFVTLGTATAVGTNSPLIGGHAYEIDSVGINSKGAITSITLRNPWGNDVANGGYVTVTTQQAYNAFGGLSMSHA